MSSFTLQKWAPPGVTALVLFLAFSSQWLFSKIDPGPLEAYDAFMINGLAACILICYWRTCFTDPGHIPEGWQDFVPVSQSTTTAQSPSRRTADVLSNRWCRKCNMLKPPRAHHCKTCQRCIVKMDHHCVWTANCISHVTIPHFIRFLCYAVGGMIYLEGCLYVRGAVLWERRHWASYLGPSVLQLGHLFVLFALNSFVLFALILLLGRTIWSLAINTWTIESWEIERHQTLLRRARVLGGSLDGPDGTKVRIEHQEFPWDVGIWANICQGMGNANPISWFWPLAASPTVASGFSFTHNEIDDPSKPWPPPDPDRLFRRIARNPLNGDGFLQPLNVDDFRRRQTEDLKRQADADGEYVIRRRPFHERLAQSQRHEHTDAMHTNGEDDDDDYTAIAAQDEGESGDDEGNASLGRRGFRDQSGEEAWRNQEGERLADYGVDEEVDFYDEDDVPLAVLLQQRKAGQGVE